MPLANSVNRNKVAHTHEVVYQLVRWFDDKVFEQCPTWENCERAGIFSRPLLEQYFGPLDKNKTGTANYAQCVERGIGRYVIVKMLAGTETDDAIRKAIEAFPMSDRRRYHLKKRWPATSPKTITPITDNNADNGQ